MMWGITGLPNALSVLRMVLSLCLIPMDINSIQFISIYLCAGLTDVLDGWIARRTGSETDLGARIDTLGDTVLFIVVIAKILLSTDIPLWLLVWIATIILIKAFNIAYVYVRKKDMLSEHTVLNKLAGLALFLLPLTLPLIDMEIIIPAVCLISTVAVFQETYTVCRGNRPS